MRGVLFSVLLSFGLLAASRVSASATPPVEPPRPPGVGLGVDGAAVLTDASLGIACSAAGDATHCLVHVHGRLEALDEVRLARGPEVLVRVDGAPIDQTTLAAGASVAIDVLFEAQISEGTVDRGLSLFTPPAIGRHLLLGESESLEREGHADASTLVFGASLVVQGGVRIEQLEQGDIDVTFAGRTLTEPTSIASETSEGTMDLTVYLVRHAEPSWPSIVAPGGPYIGGGIWGSLDGSDARGSLRFGYELSITDYVIVGVGFETDFDAIAESVLVELASPGLAILIPSVSAGIGVVARQLGRRDADAALRLALGFQFLSVGCYVDFDEYPSIGGWNLSAGGRVSI